MPSVKETLTITLTRGNRRVEHHIDCGILDAVKDNKEAAASILWGEYVIARQTLAYQEQLPKPIARKK